LNDLKIGIIGYGNIAEVHMSNLSKYPGVKIKSIFSRTNKENRIPKGILFYTDYKEMLEKEVLDAAFICTPTHTHEEIACNCAENGIHIFLEKPMSNSILGCDRIIDKVKENNVKLFIGHVLRFWPTYGSVKHFLSENRLGDIKLIVSKRLATNPWSPWFFDQSKSGGVILDLSIHDIDYVSWILNSKLISVECQAKKLSKYNTEVYGESKTKLKFENNTTADCEASWLKPADFRFYTYTKITGTENFIEFDGTQIFNNDIWRIKNEFISLDGYYNQIDQFFKFILNKGVGISGIVGREAVKICVAAIKSANNKGKDIYLKDLD
jgi:predicted dehydrogenase